MCSFRLRGSFALCLQFDYRHYDYSDSYYHCNYHEALIVSTCALFRPPEGVILLLATRMTNRLESLKVALTLTLKPRTSETSDTPQSSPDVFWVPLPANSLLTCFVSSGYLGSAFTCFEQLAWCCWFGLVRFGLLWLVSDDWLWRVDCWCVCVCVCELVCVSVAAKISTLQSVSATSCLDGC